MPKGHVRRAALLFTLVFLAGCQSAPPKATIDRGNDPAPPRSHVSEHAQDVMREDVRLGESVQGKPIDVTVLRVSGGGLSPAVLVIGGVHGDEPTGVDVARALLGELTTNPQLASNRTVAVLADANPDGHADGTRRNANDIDVNRNFPAANFKRSWRRGGGREPGSEPETKAILAAIERLRPVLIISIHSMDDGRQCNNYDGPAEALAKLMARHNGYPATANIGYPTPGSLGSYAGVDRQIPTITLELPRGASGAKAWADNRAALLAAIRGE